MTLTARPIGACPRVWAWASVATSSHIGDACRGSSLRTSFRLDVTQVIEHKGGGKKENDLLIASCRDAATFMKNFRVYVSVSYHDTHALELVATTEDVANS